MTAAAGTTWRAPERLVLDTVAAGFADISARLAQIDCIDLGGVQAIDSAGVALVRWVLEARLAAGHGATRVLEDPAGHYAALCRAHRIPVADGSQG